MIRRRLPVLCPQEYDGVDMRVTVCNRCSVGWDAISKTCTVTTGAEHLPDVAAAEVPECPMSVRCQHQVQSQVPCLVRRKGLICESALAWAGDDDPMCNPLGFSALCVASPEELVSYTVDSGVQGGR